MFTIATLEKFRHNNGKDINLLNICFESPWNEQHQILAVNKEGDLCPYIFWSMTVQSLSIFSLVTQFDFVSLYTV